jgi:hypothetical protein
MSSGRRYPIGVLNDARMLTMTRTCLRPKSISVVYLVLHTISQLARHLPCTLSCLSAHRNCLPLFSKCINMVTRTLSEHIANMGSELIT